MNACTEGNVLTHLGDLPVEVFLKEYWQQKPVLIRGALPNLKQISPDVLAGYALDEEVESRILVEKPKANEPLNSQWELLMGPQQEDTFSKLPATHWTLLVQAVDQLNSDMHELLNQFRFIPNWRVDDVMVSYASKHGSVGPHFDYYDVFLLQAQGDRLWKLGEKCSSQSTLRHDTDCKILSQFNTQQEWLVQPGDLLYIPPQIAHWGIAQSDCVTYSVGFRAPSKSEILLELSQELASLTTEDQRFCDQNLAIRENPGELQPSDIKELSNIIQSLINDENKLSNWFGRYMTQSSRSAPSFHPDRSPRLSACSRAAYILDKGNPKTCALFIDGEQYNATLEFSKALCAYQTVSAKLFPEDVTLIEYLLKEDVVV